MLWCAGVEVCAGGLDAVIWLVLSVGDFWYALLSIARVWFGLFWHARSNSAEMNSLKIFPCRRKTHQLNLTKFNLGTKGAKGMKGALTSRMRVQFFFSCELLYNAEFRSNTMRTTHKKYHFHKTAAASFKFTSIMSFGMLNHKLDQKYTYTEWNFHTKLLYRINRTLVGNLVNERGNNLGKKRLNSYHIRCFFFSTWNGRYYIRFHFTAVVIFDCSKVYYQRFHLRFCSCFVENIFLFGWNCVYFSFVSHSK